MFNDWTKKQYDCEVSCQVESLRLEYLKEQRLQFELRKYLHGFDPHNQRCACGMSLKSYILQDKERRESQDQISFVCPMIRPLYNRSKT